MFERRIPKKLLNIENAVSTLIDSSKLLCVPGGRVGCVIDHQGKYTQQKEQEMAIYFISASLYIKSMAFLSFQFPVGYHLLPS